MLPNQGTYAGSHAVSVPSTKYIASCSCAYGVLWCVLQVTTALGDMIKTMSQLGTVLGSGSVADAAAAGQAQTAAGGSGRTLEDLTNNVGVARCCGAVCAAGALQVCLACKDWLRMSVHTAHTCRSPALTSLLVVWVGVRAVCVDYKWCFESTGSRGVRVCTVRLLHHLFHMLPPAHRRSATVRRCYNSMHS